MYTGGETGSHIVDATYPEGLRRTRVNEDCFLFREETGNLCSLPQSHIASALEFSLLQGRLCASSVSAR